MLFQGHYAQVLFSVLVLLSFFLNSFPEIWKLPECITLEHKQIWHSHSVLEAYTGHPVLVVGLKPGVLKRDFPWAVRIKRGSFNTHNWVLPKATSSSGYYLSLLCNHYPWFAEGHVCLCSWSYHLPQKEHFQASNYVLQHPHFYHSHYVAGRERLLQRRLPFTNLFCLLGIVPFSRWWLYGEATIWNSLLAKAEAGSEGPELFLTLKPGWLVQSGWTFQEYK